MSIEIEVFSDRPLASTAEWQHAIDAEGFLLRLDPDAHLEGARGFFPACLGDKLMGFECYHDDAAEVIDSYPDFDFGRRWTHALGFRIMGDYAELRAAWIAATAYARATDGIVWDGESGDVLTPDKAAEMTREIERSAPKE